MTQVQTLEEIMIKMKKNVELVSAKVRLSLKHEEFLLFTLYDKFECTVFAIQKK